MKNFKKLLVLLLAMVTMFAFVACGDEDDGGSKKDGKNNAAINKSSAESVAKEFFDAWKKEDFKTMVNCMPEFMIEEGKEEMETDSIDDLAESLKEGYGSEGKIIEVKEIKVKPFAEGEKQQALEYSKEQDSEITDVAQFNVSLTIERDGDTQENEMYIALVKVGSEWGVLDVD